MKFSFLPNHFASRSLHNLVYAVVSIAMFLLLGWFFVWSLLFHVRIVDELIAAEQVNEFAHPSVFDFEAFTPIAEKLNISFSSEIGE